MKRILFVLTIIIVALSCREVPPTLPEPPPTVPGSQQRVAIIEEFTGVRCVNCPAGSEAIEDLLAIHGDKLVAVSIHAGIFSPPYDESLFDFRTSEGTDILPFLGEPIGFPTAVVNRTLFDGEASLQVFQPTWAGYINEILAQPTTINVEIEKSYDEATRQLDFTVKMTAVDDLSAENLSLTVMLTESGIKDYQETPDGKMSDYTHKHALRDVLTNFNGDAMSETFSLGAEVTKDFSYTLPDEAGWWVAENCEIIAFVHRNDGNDKTVLQATSAHVTD